MKRKLPKKEIVGYVLSSLVLILLLVLATKGKAENKQYFSSNIENTNSTYERKLDAYRDKDREESRRTYLRSSAYESRATIFEESSGLANYEDSIHLSITIPPEQPTYSSKSSQEVREVASNIRTAMTIDDAQYASVKNDIQSYYSLNNQQEDGLTARERRKRELESSWGQVSSSHTNPVLNASGYRAVIHGTQTVKRGQAVRFRVTEDIRVGMEIIPRNTIIAGVISINENRLNIRVNSVQVGTKIINHRLDVYGSDGILGIPIDYDVTGQVASSSIEDEALSQTSNVLRGTGTIGRAVGGIANTVAKASRKDKNSEITLLDNQMVILRPN